MPNRTTFIETGDRQGLTDRELKEAGWIDNEGNVRQTGSGKEGGASTEKTFDKTPGDKEAPATGQPDISQATAEDFKQAQVILEEQLRRGEISREAAAAAIAEAQRREAEAIEADRQAEASKEGQQEIIRLGAVQAAREENEKEKFSIQLAIQEAWEKPLGSLTSLKTTIALGALLTGVAGYAYFAGGATAGGTAVITRTASTLGSGSTTMTAQRAFTGKGGQTIVDQLFKALPKTAAVTTKYTTNPKSLGLTAGKLLGIAGISVAVVGGIISIVGTYPFAGFIKEEALQTLSFGVRTALDNDDPEGALIAIKEQQDIIDGIGILRSNVPFANVQEQLNAFFKAAQIKLDVDKRAVEKLQTEGTKGEQIARESEKRREDELKQREADTAFFDKQREKNREEELKQREEDTKFFDKQREEDSELFEEARRANREEELEERLLDSKYFDLIREKKFEEASALLKKELEKVKGGNNG